MKVLGIIPARYASTRLPGKPLADICGKTLVRRVYERAALSKALNSLVVATDDERIMEEIRAFGGECVLTSPDHPNGTCRTAEAARGEEADIIINIQGDEPLLDPLMIDETAALLTSGDAPSATLCEPVRDEESILDPNTVKVVMDRQGNALYFSRSPVPYLRVKGAAPVYRHIGIYGYRRDFLFTYAGLPPTPLSEAESLEQLKILEHGYKMMVAVTKGRCGPSVDTPEDLERVRAIICGKGEGAF
ncbi:MAG: 3-deoxy-manno-octulosonate cytidylyltransferase [Aminivibrio sp.]|jgi:3-deoxy-manno-octulosonate cytidylyltransferase (CMP-KDO synthetase)|nr:3-deoxy-manno-octulosonate cytidylyltransferase [Synergistaceae bacterium]